jgi:hypothetical protein
MEKINWTARYQQYKTTSDPAVSAKKGKIWRKTTYIIC